MQKSTKFERKSKCYGSTLGEKIEEPLQGVIIADTFEERFRPISLTRPCATLPFVDKNIIDYSFELLIKSDILKILIVLSKHTERVSNYIKESKYYVNKVADFEILVLKTDYYTIGDALREIERDYHSHLRGEFIVFTGFVICDRDIKDIVHRHLDRRLADDRIILTAIFNRFPSIYSAKDSKRDVMISCDANTNEIYYIESQHTSRFEIPICSINKKRQVKIHFDLNFAGLFLFDVRALQLFSDNFDFQTIEDLIHYIVGDDILQKGVCLDVIEDGYFGSINDLRFYHRMAFDVLERWAYPGAPKNTVNSHNPFNLYLGSQVELDRSALLRNYVSLGDKTYVCHLAVLDNTIIGSNCYIGSNTIIRNSYIWSNVKIESNCKIDNSIICDNVIILHDTEISTNSILCEGVVIGPCAIIPRKTFLHVPINKSEEFYIPTFINLGSASKGCVYNVFESDMIYYEWGSPSLRTDSSDSERSDDENNSNICVIKNYDPKSEYKIAVTETLINGINEHVPVDTMVTELNVSKHIYNIKLEDVYEIVGDTISKYLFSKDEIEDNKIIDQLNIHSEIISPFCNKYFIQNNARLILLYRIENYVYRCQKLKSLYMRILLQLYSNDIVDMELLNEFKNFDIKDDDEKHHKYHIQIIENFLDWAKRNHIDSDTDSDDG